MRIIESNVRGGNNITPLRYTKTDANNFTGKTYYRFKQEYVDGKITYSVVSTVKGNVNNLLAM